MSNWTTSALAIFAALGSAILSHAEVEVKPDKENVVASRLVGRWEPDVALTKQLGGRSPGKLTFKSDAAVAVKIPAKYEGFLKGKQVYLAGIMTFKDREHPFILIEHKGNPHVVYFRERDGDPLGDAESFNVMLAVGASEQDDLLFVGGDFNNQPFAASRRAKLDGK